MTKLVRIPPPVYAIMLLLLCQALHTTAPFSIDIAVPWLAAVFFTAGGGLMLWAWACFFRMQTTPLPTADPNRLVLDGPYRYTRNPMYLGVVLVLGGVLFAHGSPWFVIAPPGFFLIVDHIFIPYEEAKLQRLFGDRFRLLQDQAPRWL